MMITMSDAIKKAVRYVAGECFYCGGEADHADHVIAMKNGGHDIAENLVAACASCNCCKNDGLLDNNLKLDALQSAFIVAPEVRRVAERIKFEKNSRSSFYCKEMDFIFMAAY